jgi:penicillin-binding protein 1B
MKTKAKSSSKQKKSKKKGPVKKLRLLVLLGLLGIACFVSAFLYVDKLVLTRTERGDLATPSAVLSETFTLPPQTTIAKERLLAELTLRSYRESDEQKLPAGTYRITAQGITIHTRTALRADGEELLSSSITLKGKGEFITPENTSLYLEPLLLTRLSEGSSRAETFVPLSKIPQAVIDSVVHIEDERFYSHFGIDLIGITRALYHNILARRIVQGGSTITQQLAKNLLFTPERTISRKVMEALAALSLEFHFTKNELLEMYLNEVYLGQEGAIAIHGVGEASKSFFGKSPAELTIAESALLAGIIRAPSTYSPRKRGGILGRARRNLVLQKLLEAKKITDEQYEKARASKISVLPLSPKARGIPYFETALRRSLGSSLTLDAAVSLGARIITPIHAGLQQCATNSIVEGLAEIEKNTRKKGLEAALVAIDPINGKIKAYVGGRDFSKSQFDRVFMAHRQAGSTVKPFVYLSALDATLSGAQKPWTTLSILPDMPDAIGHFDDNNANWEPENFDHEYRGDVTLRYALEHSLNVPTVYLAQHVGLNVIAKTISAFGLKQKPLEVPSLALGAIDVSLFDLTSAYGAIANGGIAVHPRLFLSVLDQHGNVLTESPFEEKKLADDAAVGVLTNLLQGVVERGTARSLRTLGITGAVAGKTGTSNDSRDAWFVGFTPRLTAGVWVGYDNNKGTGLTGASAAVPIWAKFYQCTQKYLEGNDDEFVLSPRAIFRDIDLTTDKIANANSPQEKIVKEIFIQGTEPSEHGDSTSISAKSLTEKPEESTGSGTWWNNILGN